MPAAYAVVHNGGIGPHTAGCEEAALRLEDPIRSLAAPAPGCGGAAGNVGAEIAAAFAFVLTETTAELVGPIVSNPVELPLLPSVLAASDARGLAQGRAQRELAAGNNQRAPDQGASQRQLAAGNDARALDAGGAQRGLAAGSNARALEQGAAQRQLAQDSAARPALVLRKAVRPSAVHAGEEAEFLLTFVNDGTARIDRLVLVDRIDPWVRVVAAPGARAYVLDDRSTLLVWDDRTPLPARSERRYAVHFVARAPEEMR
jgi:hypothetical protein